MKKMCENLMDYNINDCMQFVKPNDGTFDLTYVSFVFISKIRTLFIPFIICLLTLQS